MPKIGVFEGTLEGGARQTERCAGIKYPTTIGRGYVSVSVSRPVALQLDVKGMWEVWGSHRRGESASLLLLISPVADVGPGLHRYTPLSLSVVVFVAECTRNSGWRRRQMYCSGVTSLLLRSLHLRHSLGRFALKHAN